MNSTPHRHSPLFLTFASMLLALVSTAVAWLLVRLIDLITGVAFYHRLSFEPISPAGNHLGVGVIVVPVIGGLIVGLMARFGSKAIRGHGIPEAMEQILLNRSRIPARVTLLKPLSAAISIGTGGPFGAEGPIIATGGALGSLVGQIFSVTAAERKTLLAAGAAAGMTAIFGTPISAVLLAIELLLFEFNPRSAIPVALACATAAASRVWFFGQGAAFRMTEVPFPSAGAVLAMIVLGAAVGMLAVVVSGAVYWVEDQFERLPVHWMWWPAIGGLAVGAIGYIAPRTLGVGYVNIEEILSSELPLQVVAWLAGMKLLSWLIALGSGTSGGTLAPLLTIGSGAGALLATGANYLVPALHLPVGLAALVGMAAMFAGASRALLASVVFAFEATRQPHALPALLGGCSAALLVARVVARHSIMTEKIARRGVVVPHTFEPDPLAHIRVADVMERELQTVAATMTLEELARRIGANDPAVCRRQASLVVDEAGELVGIITRGDVLQAVGGEAQDATVFDICSRSPVVAYPDEPVSEMLLRMIERNVGRLPIVERKNPRRLAGYLGRVQILAARARAHNEQHVKEPGWLKTGVSKPSTTAAGAE